MIGSMLIRGMLVGVFAGLMAYVFANVVGEPAINRAIDFETLQSHHEQPAHAHQHEEESSISRSTQAGIGMLTGLLVFGATAGGLYAMAFALLYRRVGPRDARRFAAWLAAIAFLVLVVAPSLKYPANPPAVGDPDSIGQRTVLYFAMLVISITAGAIALRAGRTVDRPLRSARSRWLTLGCYAAIVLAACSLLPSMNIVIPEGFPVDALWQFRLASLGTHLLLWSVIGLCFGVLTAREQTLRQARQLPTLSV